MNNDPTEPVSEGNPYPYYNNPYVQTGPPAPPSPPKRKMNLGVFGGTVLCVVGLLLTGAILYVGIAGIPWQQASPSQPVSTLALAPTPIHTLSPTATPTPTPTPTLAVQIIPASQIVTYFYRIGLAPQNPNLDTSWSCCQYYPEGGAVYWNDLQTGITMDLATFDNIQEAQTDAQNLESQGFGADIVNYCLLSYSGNPSDLQSYVVTMQAECIYKQ